MKKVPIKEYKKSKKSFLDKINLEENLDDKFC